jgi:hypothetical protein
MVELRGEGSAHARELGGTAVHQRMFAAGLAVVIGCATPTVIDAAAQGAAAQARSQADDQSREQLQLARELPANPPDVAGAFVDLLAEGGPFAAYQGCLLFDNAAAAQFAAAQHATDCIAAMTDLHRLVSDPAAYINDLTVPDAAWTQFGTTATLNGCALDWSGPLSDRASDTPSPAPGPLPGLWTLTQLDGEGWQITRYEPC